MGSMFLQFANDPSGYPVGKCMRRASTISWGAWRLVCGFAVVSLIRKRCARPTRCPT